MNVSAVKVILYAEGRAEENTLISEILLDMAVLPSVLVLCHTGIWDLSHSFGQRWHLYLFCPSPRCPSSMPIVCKRNGFPHERIVKCCTHNCHTTPGICHISWRYWWCRQVCMDMEGGIRNWWKWRISPLSRGNQIWMLNTVWSNNRGIDSTFEGWGWWLRWLKELAWVFPSMLPDFQCLIQHAVIALPLPGAPGSSDMWLSWGALFPSVHHNFTTSLVSFSGEPSAP